MVEQLRLLFIFVREHDKDPETFFDLLTKLKETGADFKMSVIVLFVFVREHDKDPETFFDLLTKLKETGADFKMSVIGQGFSDKPGM